MVISDKTSFSTLKQRLADDYGFEVSLKYQDVDGDLIVLSTQNDLDEMMEHQLNAGQTTVTVRCTPTVSTLDPIAPRVHQQAAVGAAGSGTSVAAGVGLGRVDGSGGGGAGTGSVGSGGGGDGGGIGPPGGGGSVAGGVHPADAIEPSSGGAVG